MTGTNLRTRFKSLLFLAVVGFVGIAPVNLPAQEGSLDTTLNPNLGRGFSQPVVNALTELRDGKVLIGGEFVTVNGTARNRIARLNSDGTLDSSFGSASGADGAVQCIAVQEDGRVLIGGMFTSVHGTTRNRIARLNSDGTLDPTFGPASGADGAVGSIVVQGDGRVLIGGFFTSFNGTTRNRIARLNSDGSLDASFNVGTGANAGIECMALQTDGKVLIGGDFTSVGGTARNRMARLNGNGSLDTGFNPGSGIDDWVESMVVQIDGKVVIGGKFKTVNSAARTRLARLNSNGSLDTLFNPILAAVSGYGMDIDAIAVQDDGKMVIGGSFGTVNGTARIRVARLNSDGTLDPSFNSGSGPNDWVFSLAVQRDGRILIGGWFTSVSGTPRTQMARLLGSTPAAVAPSITAQPQSQTVSVGGSVTLSVTATGTPPFSYQWRKSGANIPGATGPSLALNNVSASDAGAYTVVVSNAGGSVTSSSAVLTIDSNSPVSFLDAKLEAAVRLALAQPSGAITRSNLLALTELSLPTGGVTNLAGLEWAVNLDYLNAEHNQIHDATPLAGLSNLTRLRLNENALTNVAALSELKKLTTLALYNNAISDPAPLAGLTNLAELYLNDNRLTDLRGFSRLTRLSSLDVGHNLISDVAPLAGLTNLTDLRLQENALTNIAPLSGLTKLTFLMFYENQITNAAPLAGLTNLTELHSNNNRLTDLAALSGLKRLTGLYLASNSISDVGPLAGLTNLTGLYLNSNPLTNLSPLSGLTKLTELSLYGNSIRDVGPLAGLTNLTLLYLSGNRFSDASGLSGLVKLTELIVADNLISDLTPFASLTNLTWLALKANHLTNIAALSRLTKLTELYLASNTIEDIAPLAGLANVTILDVSGNWLTNLPALAGLGNLTDLNVKNNLLDVRDGSSVRGVIQTLVNRGVKVEYDPQNTLPRISPIADQIAAAGATTPPITFRVADLSTPAGQLTVRGSSSDVSVVPDGAITFGGSGANRFVTIKASTTNTPAAGQFGTTSITIWVMDGTESESTSFALRVVPPQVLAIDVQGSGSVSKTPEKAEYAFGDPVTLTATPGRYYAFSRWLDGEKNNPRTVTVGLTNHFLAVFTNTVPLETLTIGGTTREAPVGMPVILVNGQFSPTNRFSFGAISTVEITIQSSFANRTIYYSLDGSDPSGGTQYTGPFAVSQPNPPRSLTVRAVAYDAAFTTSRESDPLVIDPSFALTVTTPGGGTVAVDPPNGPYQASAVVAVTAAPVGGWAFLRWSGDASGTNATLSVTLDRAKSIQAVFGTALTTSVLGGGSIALNPSQGPYPYGSNVRLSTTPSAGNFFRFWGGVASGQTVSPLDFTVTNANPTVSAVFAPLPADKFALNTLINGEGTVTKNPQAENYSNSQTVAVTARPAAGYTFSEWSGDGSGTENPLTVAMNSSKTIAANFKVGEMTLPTILSQPQSQTVNAGSSLTLSVSVSGTTPLTYQWRKDGTNLSGATNSSVSLGIVSTSDTGAYTVVVSNPAGAVTSSVATLTISQPDHTIAFGPLPNRIFGDEPFAVSATASSGLPVALSVASGAARLTNQTVYLTGAGTVVIRADQGGNGSVKAAPPVSQSFEVAPPKPQQFTTNQGALVAFSVLATNVSGLQYSIQTPPVGGGAVVSNGTMTYTPNPAFYGTDKFNYLVEDPVSGAKTPVPVEITLKPLAPVFWIGQTNYLLKEGAGTVDISVRKNLSAAASIDYTTVAGSANPVIDGTGDYTHTTGTLSFGSGETNKLVSIPIKNDQVRELDEFFTFQIYGPSSGTVGSPSTALITIQDDDAATGNLLFTDIRYPNPRPFSAGRLRLDLWPPDSGGLWRLAGQPQWHASGETVEGLPDGDYRVEFSGAAGGYIQPAPLEITVAGGALASRSVYYVGTTPRTGSLIVNLLPLSVANAPVLTQRGQWRRKGESTWRESGAVQASLNEGSHVIEFKSVERYVKPKDLTVTVVKDAVSAYSVAYVASEVAPGLPPTVVHPNSIDLANFPYAFNGQISTEAGLGSGFVVKERVVLTAAHVVYDDSKLDFARQVQWFFQRYKGSYEPKGERPRGWYVSDSYSSQRRLENTPGLSSPRAKNLDAAALYFSNPAGRGGYGGYLASDADNNEWLVTGATGSRLKILCGYPIDDIAEADQGKLHATGVAPINFTQVFQRVFKTTEIKSYGGNSGGPLCVEYNGRYYPAAIFLGGSGQLDVRAIDSSVVDLINRAEVSGSGGANNTSGGVITFESALTDSSTGFGYLTVQMEPTAAVGAGAGWRIVGGDPVFVKTGVTTLPLVDGDYNLEFADASGYVKPPISPVQIFPGTNTVFQARYESKNRVTLTLDLAGGLRLQGSKGSSLRIETKTALDAGQAWQPVATITLTNEVQVVPGFQLQGTGTRFFRAVLITP